MRASESSWRRRKRKKTSTGDTKAASEFKRAAKHKKTPEYRGAVRAAYTAQPVAARRKRVAQARTQKSPESKVITRTHKARVERNRELRWAAAQKDTKGSSDLLRGTRRPRESMLLENLSPKERKAYAASPASVKKQMLAAAGSKELLGVAGPKGIDRLLDVIGTTGLNVGKATYHDPFGVPAKTAKGIATTALAAIPGTLKLIGETGIDVARRQPGKAINRFEEVGKGIGDYYSEEYGPIWRGEKGASKKQMKQFREEGAAGAVLDALALAPAAGQAARLPVFLGKSAKHGGFKAAKEHGNRPRPAMRLSGGDETVVPQPLGRPGRRRASERTTDALRGLETKRRAKRGNPVAQMAVERGEITPLRQHRAAALMEDREAHAVRHEQTADRVPALNEMLKRQRSLSDDEAVGFKFAVETGVRDPDTARQVADKRLQQIHAQIGDAAFKAATAETHPEIFSLRYVRDHADKVVTPKLADAAEGHSALAARTGAEDPALGRGAQVRAAKPQAEMLGLNPYRTSSAADVDKAAKTLRKAQKDRAKVEADPKAKPGERAVARANARAAEDALAILTEARGPTKGETPEQFSARVEKAAAREGLAPGGYFTSSDMPARDLSGVHALGGQKGAVASPKRYEGSLFRSGTERGDIDLSTAQILSNIKRKHNWPYANDLVQRHAFPWSLGGMTIDQILRKAEADGIPENQLGFYAVNQKRIDPDDPDTLDADPDDVDVGGGGEFYSSLADLKKKDPEYRKTTKFVAMPKFVTKELESSLEVGSKTGRALDITKGNLSGWMLGTSPQWSAFQVAANTLQSLQAGASPLATLKGNLFFKRTPEGPEKRRMETAAGIVHDRHQEAQIPKMGVHAGRVTRAKRSFQESKAGKVAHAVFLPGRYKDLALDFDRIQTNFFRRGVFYDDLRSQRVDRMRESAGGVHAAVEKLKDIGRVEDAAGDLRKLAAEDRKAVLQAGEKTRDWMGDFAAYTANERKGFKRHGMFYGFLRFSLQFSLKTLPSNHPILTDIYANLGRLHEEEVRDLFDIPEGMSTPHFLLGQLGAIDINRANPASNILFSATEAPLRALGALPPHLIGLAESALSFDTFRGKPVSVGGRTKKEARWPHGGLPTAFRMYLENLAETQAPYRETKKSLFTGPQSATSSLLFGEDEIFYKDPEIRKSIEKSKRTQRKQDDIEQIFRGLSPAPLGKDVAHKAVVRSMVEEWKREHGGTKPKPKSRKKPQAIGASSGGAGW
jgi:hypothetical protein